MRKLNPNFHFILLLVFVSSIVSARANKGNLYKYSIKSIPALKMVFVDEKDTLNKTVLKLYDDQSYEYLSFIKIKNRLSVKREIGNYVLEGSKLKLEVKNEKSALEHPTHFYYNENKGLFEKKKEMENNSSPMLSKVIDDKKYRGPFYIDPVFGKISNNYKVFNKLNDPEWIIQERKEKEEQEEKWAKREVDKMDSIYKSSLIKDSLDLVLWQSETKKLKAVIIVGDVDTEESDGWWNKMFFAQQKKNAKYLRDHGVLVKEFYHPNTKWKDIVKACEGANIFIYSGHGSNQGINHAAGGLCLVDGIHGAAEIMNEINLAKNALVIFNSACSSAGGSADDKSDIGYKEAQLRTGEYAYPFLNNGAGAYLANNNIDWVPQFFDLFLKANH